MNPTQTRNSETNRRSVSNRFLSAAAKHDTGIAKIRHQILREFGRMTGVSEHLLRLALNEAEALAWETEVPHLVFPVLATEKARAVAAWSARQKALRRTEFDLAFAA